MAKKKKTNRLAKGKRAPAGRMPRAGLLDRAAYATITLRPPGAKGAPKPPPISGEQIRAMRTRAKMSQTVFARHLNLTMGYVSQLERGVKQPSGALLAFLNVVKRKGIEVTF
jgi:putative transcriptional regulator